MKLKVSALSTACLAPCFPLFRTALAASPYSVLPSLSLLTGRLSNVTFPANVSAPGDSILTAPPNRNLPSDPFSYLVPHAHVPDAEDIVVKFYHYGPLLAKGSIYMAVSEALRDVREHQGEGEEFIGTEERWYDDDGDSHVVLLLHPGEDMEWYAWGRVMRGLVWFVDEYDGVELFFDVFEKDKEDGYLHLQGTGALAR